MTSQSANLSRMELSRPHAAPAIVIPVCTNPLLRLGLEKILSEAGFVMWHESVDGVSKLPAVKDEANVLFIIDESSFGDEVPNLIRRLRDHAPAASIVMLADSFDAERVSAAWDAGAHGFCLSTQRHDVLVKSLELVMLGEAMLPAAVVLSMSDLDTKNRVEEISDLISEGCQGRKLSSRETEILKCLTEGAPNKVIARKLNLSEATVKVHVKTILKKIGACNRTQAALWAARYVSLGSAPMSAA